MLLNKIKKRGGLIVLVICLLTATTLAGNTLNKTQISDHLNTLRNASTDIGSYGDILINIFNANGEIKSEFLEASSLWDVSGNNISYTTGNVGIGTAATSAKLQVNGKIQSTATTAGDSTSTLVTKGYIDDTYLTKSGGLVTANLDVNNQRLMNIPAPVGNTDAANKAYVDAVTAAMGSSGGGNYQVSCVTSRSVFKCLRILVNTGETECIMGPVPNNPAMQYNIPCNLNFDAGVNGSYEVNCIATASSDTVSYVQCVRINKDTGSTDCKRQQGNFQNLSCNVDFDTLNPYGKLIKYVFYIQVGDTNFGGEFGADNFCNGTAQGNGFKGNFKALLLGEIHSSVGSKFPIDYNEQYVNVHGHDLGNNALYVRNMGQGIYNISGSQTYNFENPWLFSGITSSGGKQPNNCNNFTSNSGFTYVGNTGNGSQFDTSYRSCGSAGMLICVQD